MGDKISDISNPSSGLGSARGLYEKIEEKEEDAEKKKETTPREAALRQLGDGMEETGRDDPKTGLAARFIKGTRRDMAGKISAQEREFVLHPDGKLLAITPKIDRPDYKNKIPEEGKKTEIWS
jgi:hypothetical protein